MQENSPKVGEFRKIVDSVIEQVQKKAQGYLCGEKYGREEREDDEENQPKVQLGACPEVKR